jgi:phage shock protein PspC (stress-responsive transcriptional regulator)
MTRRNSPLYRDTDDRKIGGVCSGLARYFDVDTTLVRVVFVSLLVFGGGSLVAYLLLWWLVDPAPAGEWDRQADRVDPTGPTAPDVADESHRTDAA